MRLRLKHVTALALAAAVAVLVADAMTPEFKCDGTAVMVESGDSLWTIADSHCTGSIQAAVDAMVSDYGPDIVPGQLVWLP